ncbi:MAG TPA: hypothetical protein VNR66_12815 [Solirubrobacteraceae bacterium]|nr:hypothetical protein [Solirubrobacteraceae bacterium]
MKKVPVVSRAGRVKMAWAASPTISGRRDPFIATSPPTTFWTAAVAISVRGQSALKATPSGRNSSAMPIVSIAHAELGDPVRRMGAEPSGLDRQRRRERQHVRVLGLLHPRDAGLGHQEPSR